MMNSDARTQRPTLSRLEWNVIALAIREAGEARRTAGGLVALSLRLIRRTMGDPGDAKPLGSTKLEALRRFVDSIRRGGRASPALEDQLVAFGYSAAQLAAVAALAR